MSSFARLAAMLPSGSGSTAPPAVWRRMPFSKYWTRVPSGARNDSVSGMPKPACAFRRSARRQERAAHGVTRRDDVDAATRSPARRPSARAPAPARERRRQPGFVQRLSSRDRAAGPASPALRRGRIDQRHVLVVLNDVGVAGGGEVGSGADLLGDRVAKQIAFGPPEVEEQSVSGVPCGGNEDRARSGPVLRRCGERDEQSPRRTR